MSGRRDVPEPGERSQPDGRRTQTGVRIGVTHDEARSSQAVLSAVVENEPSVLAEVTGLLACRKINVEHFVSEPINDGLRLRILFVVKPPHPGVEQVITQLENLLPVVEVEGDELDTEPNFACSIDDVGSHTWK